MLKFPLTLITILAATAGPPLAAPPSVVADVPAVGSLAQQVMGDLATVHVLLPTGASLHHHQLKPSDARALQDADMLIWVGAELTPWLTRAAADRNAASVVSLLGNPATATQGFGAGEPDDHGAEGDAHDHDHDHEGIDPHAWLDPGNGIAWTRAIADALAARDPDNVAIYAENAAELVERIEAMDADLQARIAPARDKQFVVFHDAYGYFTAHFGLSPAIAVSLGDASAPSAAHLAQLRDRLAAEQVICAFPEAQHSAEPVAAVIEGTGIRMGDPLDPSGSGLPASDDLYGAILTGMGDALIGCLAPAS